jgi:hypothetical protein
MSSLIQNTDLAVRFALGLALLAAVVLDAALMASGPSEPRRERLYVRMPCQIPKPASQSCTTAMSTRW